MLNNKNILITGGTGSFGTKCTEIILKKFKPKKLIIFSRDELKQFEMSQKFQMEKYPVRYFIGDVRDKERLHRAFHKVDYVIHAAALKQVPAAEYNPFEAVKTNVLGAQNIIDVAIDQKVKRVIALSTDKAVNPINLYGATKLCSDKLFTAANSYVGQNETIFSVVRYGNVLGSRGSVIPVFLKQKERGLLTITDARMTRFWITLEDGVNFVLECLNKMVGGELFVPKISSMSVMDLAEAIAPGCKKEIVGIRVGEKLHEVLITNEDARNTYEFDNHYVIKNELLKRHQKESKGKPVPEEFEYNSKTNPMFLNINSMKKLIANLVE